MFFHKLKIKLQCFNSKEISSILDCLVFFSISLLQLYKGKKNRTLKFIRQIGKKWYPFFKSASPYLFCIKILYTHIYVSGLSDLCSQHLYIFFPIHNFLMTLILLHMCCYNAL